MAIDAEGRKTVLGYSITPEESAEAYGELLESFASRGLRRVEIVVSDFVAICKAADRNGAATLLRGFRDKWGSRYPSVRRWLERTEGIITFMDYPAEIRRLIYTNNPIESMNKHIKRELKKQIQFVTEEALEKRLVTMFLHYNMGLSTRKVKGRRVNLI